MTTFNFQPDDPRLTAYALGELDLTERAQVEAMLAESAEARTALEGIRETIALLSRELTFEPALTLTTSQREFLEQAVVVPKPIVSESPGKTARWVVIVRTATTVAAVAAVAVAVPLVSRSWRDGASQATNEPTIAYAQPTSGANSSPAEKRLAQGAGNVRTLSEFVLTPEEALKRESITGSEGRDESFEKQGQELTKKEQSSAISGLATAAVDAKASSESEELQESESGRGISWHAVDGSSPLAKDDVAGGKPDSEAMPGLASRFGESKTTDQSELGVQAPWSDDGYTAFANQPLDLAKNNASYPSSETQWKRGETPSSASSDTGPGGFGFRVGSQELKQLGESIELGKDKLTPFGLMNDAVSGTEVYEPIVENAFLTPMEQPLSTFSIDVDTASYANMRRFIQQGQLPPAGAVRIEELVNYFRYDYPEPVDGSPFSVNIDVATCPWNPQNKLARIGLKAKTIAEDKRPATNLVFLIDVSGSMAAENKLPLVKQALSVLVSKMGEDDQIAIVTYAGEAGLKLNSTSGSQRAVIQQAIDSLQSGGSTNGAAGINIAYDTAIQSFVKGGANRVILCTDGDFNVGVSDDNTLVEIIQEKAASGVFLSVFGFGMGNLKDAKLEKLADKGNGNYGYIDGLGEARKVFGQQLSGTLITVAKDVKLQLEFNSSTVGAYRLIGYENRVLAAQDFDDDTKDAGEIGAGHTVTALYEIVPKAAWLTQAGLDPEKFDIVEKTGENGKSKAAADGRLFTVKLRHKLPDAETSERSVDYAAMNSDVPLSDSNVDFRFAAAVASFGMQIRDSKFRGSWTLQNVLSIADASLSTDRNGERTEFTDLVRGVMRIKGESVSDPRLNSHPTVAPATPPAELSANDARIKATVDGKYRRLLKKIEVRSDVSTFGEFRDFGQWDGTDYSGHSDLPTGYWVWVYPNWYIWGDVVTSPGSE